MGWSCGGGGPWAAGRWLDLRLVLRVCLPLVGEEFSQSAVGEGGTLTFFVVHLSPFALPQPMESLRVIERVSRGP